MIAITVLCVGYARGFRVGLRSTDSNLSTLAQWRPFRSKPRRNTRSFSSERIPLDITHWFSCGRPLSQHWATAVTALTLAPQYFGSAVCIQLKGQFYMAKVLFGLPCSHCHVYYDSTLAKCPVCGCKERISASVEKVVRAIHFPGWRSRHYGSLGPFNESGQIHNQQQERGLI